LDEEKEVTQDSQKQGKIVSMFDDIAPTYDTANRVLSMGIDIAWRKRACSESFAILGEDTLLNIVDVACGTGDMMNHWLQGAKRRGIVVENIVGVDPSEGMLTVAKEKFPNFSYHTAAATSLPFEDSSVDIISISYGLRNVVNRKEALDEFHRVLRPGGVLVILEFMKNEQENFLYTIRNWYLNRLLPKIGGFISSNYEAYHYLPNSIGDFITVQGLHTELEAHGFSVAFTKSFSMNISSLVIAKKL